ncbi:MAG TPA: hypothetical protein VM802_01030 [Chitinophaga sp.]|uniref:hypothetical protein n=1 Tax=Chitinophaga sp. TaxID=1869181 RepID=UPI002BA47BD5|nr:hypothetical protein [Chitinophaga sp.]HVI43415.1 hypothetical protein [Chitinophaga sp.]
MNRCNCPLPPGGQVVCERNQMAICIVRNGQAIHQCLDPGSIKGDAALLNWALAQITGRESLRTNSVHPPDLQMLTKGTYRDGKTMVNFSLTQDMQDALFRLTQGGNTTSDEMGMESTV